MESKRGFFMAHWVSIMDWGLKTWTVSWYHWFKRLFLFWDVRQRGLICEVHTTQVVVSKILYFYPYLVKWSNLTCAYFQLGGSTTNHQPSANCNAFEIMSSTMQCGSATVFLVPFHSVSQLWRYVSPSLPGGEVSHPVHHACIGAGGPLLYILSRFKLNVGYQRCGHAFVGCGPLPRFLISSRNPSENCQHRGCLETRPPFFFGFETKDVMTWIQWKLGQWKMRVSWNWFLSTLSSWSLKSVTFKIPQLDEL